MKIIEAHGDVYAATGSIAYPHDLFRKARRARESGKPAFIHVLTPCPTGWEYDTHLTVELARLAVETGFTVLYEYENGQRRITKLVKERKPVEEYLSEQGRFSHLSPDQVTLIQAEIDQRYDEIISRASLPA